MQVSQDALLKDRQREFPSHSRAHSVWFARALITDPSSSVSARHARVSLLLPALDNNVVLTFAWPPPSARRALRLAQLGASVRSSFLHRQSCPWAPL